MIVRHIALPAVLVLSLCAGAQAEDSMAMDKPLTVAGVETVCTGIGLEARENPAWHAYPLKVEVAGRGGQYLGDVHVLLSKDGLSVASLTCSGPWVLFRVPAGRYRVEAQTEGKMVSAAALAPEKGQGRVILRFPDLGGETSTNAPPAEPRPAQQ